MTIKFRIRSWLGHDWQLAILPHLSIFWGGNLCIGAGWLFWVAEVWIGSELDELR